MKLPDNFVICILDNKVRMSRDSFIDELVKPAVRYMKEVIQNGNTFPPYKDNLVFKLSDKHIKDLQDAGDKLDNGIILGYPYIEEKEATQSATTTKLT